MEETSLKILARNVRIFREGKNLSREALAQKAGLDEKTIEKIEKIKLAPSHMAIAAIAKALGERISDFYYPFTELRDVRFRANKKGLGSRARQLILAKIAMELDDLNFLEEELGQKLGYSLAGLSARGSEIGPVEMAALCREKMGLTENEPVINIYDSLERAGVKVLSKANLPIIFFGLAIGEGGMGPAIFVNSDESITWQRRVFSAAHELGHLLLHPDSFNVAENSVIEEEEKEADLFAGHFLMPDKAFDVQLKQLEALRNSDHLDIIFKLRDFFNVSCLAVVHRIIEKKIFDNFSWPYFYDMFYQKYHLSDKKM
jgi:Zn-dependent peptidase ImmA (M78 family)/transcriptional regulator with XRE-family HTH domain